MCVWEIWRLKKWIQVKEWAKFKRFSTFNDDWSITEKLRFIRCWCFQKLSMYFIFPCSSHIYNQHVDYAFTMWFLWENNNQTIWWRIQCIQTNEWMINMCACEIIFVHTLYNSIASNLVDSKKKYLIENSMIFRDAQDIYHIEYFAQNRQ